MDGRRAESASSSNNGACPFLRRQSVKRSFGTMAGTRRSSSPDSLFVSDHTPLALPPRRTRYPGDGLDFRRPVTTARGGMSSTVIDLTEEEDTHDTWNAPEVSRRVATPEPGPSNTRHRLLNFHTRSIIDVGDVDRAGEDQTSQGGSWEGPSEAQHQPQHPNHHSPQPRYPFNIMERPLGASNATTAPRRRTRQRQQSRSITPHPGITPHPAAGSNTIDLTGEDDDVVVTEVRPRVPQLNTGRPEITAGTGTVARGLMERIFGIGLGAGPGAAALVDAGARARTPHMPTQGRPAGVVINFDYLTVGFEVGGEPDRPPTPAYEAPPPAEPGFTRTPGEGQEIVCPNCGDELCTGEGDIKQQVWVIKTCGHAYCGECAQTRAAKKPKGKGKAKVDTSLTTSGPMRECQVLGCGASVANKNMLRVYVDG